MSLDLLLSEKMNISTGSDSRSGWEGGNIWVGGDITMCSLQFCNKMEPGDVVGTSMRWLGSDLQCDPVSVSVCFSFIFVAFTRLDAF